MLQTTFHTLFAVCTNFVVLSGFCSGSRILCSPLKNARNNRKSLTICYKLSIAEQASSLNFKPSTVHQILRQELSMRLYKIIVALKLNPADLPKYKLFAEKRFLCMTCWLLIWLIFICLPMWKGKIVNSGPKKIKNMHKEPLHNLKFPVWVGIAGYGITGLIFLNRIQKPVTIIYWHYVAQVEKSGLSLKIAFLWYWWFEIE